MGLRDKIFGEPLNNIATALKSAQTSEDKAQIFKAGFQDMNSRYNEVAGKGAIVIGSVLGGAAIAGAAGTAKTVKDSNLSGLFNDVSGGIAPVPVPAQQITFNPLYIIIGIGFILLLFLRK